MNHHVHLQGGPHTRLGVGKEPRSWALVPFDVVRPSDPDFWTFRPPLRGAAVARASDEPTDHVSVRWRRHGARPPVVAEAYRKYKAPFHARPPAGASPHPARVPPATGSHPPPRQRWTPQEAAGPRRRARAGRGPGDGEPARLGGGGKGCRGGGGW